MSWPIRKIGDITSVVTKGTTPTKDQGFSESGVNFIKAEALNGDSALDHKGIFHISEDVHQKLKRSILQHDDVLLTIAGAQIEKCGMVTTSHLPANTNQAVGIIRIDQSKADPRFIYYGFKQKRTFAYIQGLNAQAAQPNINLSMLKNIDVPQPSITEQQSISSVLSAYDDLIENNRRRIQLLEQAARLLYKEWFVHLRFPGHEHVKIKDGVPEGWVKGTVSNLGQIITGKTPSTKTPENFGGVVLFVKTPDMHRSRIIVEAEESLSERGVATQANKTLPVGTILVACIGAKLGVVSITSRLSQTNQQINAVIPHKDYLRYFSLFALIDLKQQLEAMGGGATMPNVNKSKFSSIPVVIPSTTLLRAFDEFAKASFQQMQLLHEQISLLTKARDLLLPRLMNGRIFLS